MPGANIEAEEMESLMACDSGCSCIAASSLCDVEPSSPKPTGWLQQIGFVGPLKIFQPESLIL